MVPSRWRATLPARHLHPPLIQRTRTPPAGGTGAGAALPDHDGGDGRDQTWYDEQFHAIVTDLVGAPVALVTSDGRLNREPDRSLWGVSLAGSDDGGDRHGVTCPLRFPGQYHDPETGLRYNYFRHYNPVTATYTTPDPIGLHGGPNPHSYVPNPLEWIDPLGLTYLSGSGTADAGRGWSISARMRAAGPGDQFGLPGQGRIRYVPPRGYNPASPLPRGPQDGYIDRFGNEWAVGPTRTEGQPFEWDVQLSKTGQKQLDWLSRDGSHVNVSPLGEVTH